MGQRLEPAALVTTGTGGGGETLDQSPLRRVSRFFRRRRGVGLGLLLTPPVFWLLVVYILSLVLMVAAAMFHIDSFTNKPTTDFTTDNLRTAFTEWGFVNVVLRSVYVAVGVTVLCLAISLPMAFYIAKLAKPWARRGLIVAALLPLWAGYLVKGYAWKAMLRPASAFGVNKDGGFLVSVFGWTPGFGMTAVVISLTYLWLPFMMLPIYTGIARLPPSLLDASADLGGRPFRTFRSVIMPLLIPSIAAGSIFTFSLSLGDYITPKVVTEGKVRLVGNLIESTLLAPNQPLAAAFTIWPLLIIVVYLLAMRRMGAFESL